MPEPIPARYVMGHDDRERKRLDLQASILNPITEPLLRRAGITSGMRVLDLGCGTGEVSCLAAALVGRHGRVVGLDIDPVALNGVKNKAEQRGLPQITVVHSNLDDFRPEQEFDAVIGRHILIHSRDPLQVLHKAYAMLRPGGVAVFQEYDFSVIQPAYPACPLRDRGMEIFRDFFSRAGTHGNVGARLFHLFVQAGFPAPDCRAEYPIDGGPDSPFYEWIAEALRSILSAAEALGIVSSQELQIDTLAARLREEAVAAQAGCPGPVMVGGFARKP